VDRKRLPVPDRAALARLARAAQENEPRAVDALLAAVRPTLARWFGRHLARDAAEDLTQTALIRMTEALGQMRAERVAQHLSTIARSLLLEERLQRAREARRAAFAPLGETIEWPVDLALAAERDELLRAVGRACAAALPPDLQAVMPVMLGERTVSEVAADTGLDAVGVRLRLARARAILRRELAGYHSKR